MGYILTLVHRTVSASFMTVTDPVASELLLPPRYQIRAVLKETPATAVYRVFDCSDNRDEAIKILRHEVHELQKLLQFKSEFYTMASLEHASIIKVFHFRLLHDRFPFFTMQYLAPEVLRQERDWWAADLYALGMTLYETVTGALPGYGKAPIDVIRMHLDEEIRPPSAINPQIPPKLEEIILKLLEKDPRHRHATAAALVRDVADAAGKTGGAGGLLAWGGGVLSPPRVWRQQHA